MKHIRKYGNKSQAIGSKIVTPFIGMDDTKQLRYASKTNFGEDADIISDDENNTFKPV